MTQVSSGIQPHGNESMVLTPVGNLGNYFSQRSRRATRLQWMENWAPRTLHLRGEHRFQVGSVLGYSEAEGQLHTRAVQIIDAQVKLLQRIDFTSGSRLRNTNLPCMSRTIGLQIPIWVLMSVSE